MLFTYNGNHLDHAVNTIVSCLVFFLQLVYEAANLPGTNDDKTAGKSISPSPTPGLCQGQTPSLEFEFYYSDGMVFQRGPGSHHVWGFTNNPTCNFLVTETCGNEYCKLTQLGWLIHSSNFKMAMETIATTPDTFICIYEKTALSGGARQSNLGSMVTSKNR